MNIQKIFIIKLRYKSTVTLHDILGLVSFTVRKQLHAHHDFARHFSLPKRNIFNRRLVRQEAVVSSSSERIQL